MTVKLNPPFDGWAEWHQHFFAPDGSSRPHDTYDPADEEKNEIIGRYDAVEDRLGRIFVWSAETAEVVQICQTREEACRIAKGLATI